ncbi:hypothetical protein HB780_02440 (plasmid) [Rhizobium lusitanum]|uniref:hypothetical protein n=1 Tax=Rhizobium lusitanum TaxID=293958 RepID=UPI0016154D6C|nr:hypothetical protein [Rhizobium lusitanum]QND44660.1 hypothetical protein HB780_02440 [Rhizobium lusitanum]
MNHQTIQTTAAVVSLIVTIFAVVISTTFQSSGTNIPKKVEVEYTGPTDPLSDLKETKVDLNVSVSSEGQNVDRLIFYQTSITNSSNVPILPSDFFGNMKLVSKQPWQIVAIGRSKYELAHGVVASWARQSDNEFDSPPILLNPGEALNVTVYLTAPEAIISAQKFDDPAPIAWDMHIANLASLEETPNPVTRFRTSVGNILVTIWGWGIWTVLGLFIFLLGTHLLLLTWSGLVNRLNPLGGALVVYVALLSLIAAETINTMIFGVSPLFYVPGDLSSRLPICILNFVVLAATSILSYRSRRRRGKVQRSSEL